MDKISAKSVNFDDEFSGLPNLEEDAAPIKRCLRKKGKTIKCKSLSLPLKIKSGQSGLAKYEVQEHYNIFEKIGFGTYSEVRKAIDRDTEQRVALKIAKGSTSCNLLKSEAELLKQLSSDYLPKFYSFNQDLVSNKAYLAMEYIEGKPLDSYIREHGVFSEEIANQLVLQLIKAVEELHSHGIAHRDIKPQNILITDDLSLKLIDLNVSKQSRSSSASSEGSIDNKFRCVFFTQISSPMYAAPELTSLNCYTESIDIWGIGIAYAHMLINTSELESIKMLDLLNNFDDFHHLSDFTRNVIKLMCSSDPSSRPSISDL